MKTKITQFKITFWALSFAILFTLTSNSQTHVYNDDAASGIFIDGGSEVANPASDAVNSSSTCVLSGTGWQKTEFFPTYTPVSGDKLYFSIYNPNTIASAQIKFDYTSGETEVWGGNVTYDAGAANRWVEHSLDLTEHAGKEINKIWLYLASGETKTAYIDNIYFHTSSVLNPATIETHVYNDDTASGIFIDGGSEVANPASDAVNSSTTCVLSGTGWQKTEFFPTYTPVSGDKLYFSVYNPNTIASAQIKFDYTSGETEVWGGNITYNASAANGWVEHNLDLTEHVGKEINKIWLYLASGETKTAYLDNIYFHTSSVIVTPETTTYFFQDAVQNGTVWHASATEVANPLSDAANSSSTVIQNTGTGAWQDTQINGISYTIQTGDMFYMSVYNPNAAAAWQLKMVVDATDTWIAEPAHVAGAASAWQEVSVDLSAYVGQNLSQIKIYPAAGESKSIYFDTIYISTSSVLSSATFQIKNDTKVFISSEGKINFIKEQTNATLYVFDVKGALLFKENIKGNRSRNLLNKKGIYFLKMKNEKGLNNHKVLFH
jgi:hypothetical protein